MKDTRFMERIGIELDEKYFEVAKERINNQRLRKP